MGSCSFKKQVKSKQPPLELDQISRYPRVGKLIIRSKNPSGKIMGHTNIHFTVTEPTKLTSKQIEFTNSKSWISSCVLPGLDPRGDCSKGCQDNCIYIENEKSLLLALFDGHGPDGAKVSQFCCKYIEKYFLEKFQTFKNDISSFLIKLAHDCDLDLRHNGYDILYSGSTGVFVIVHEGAAYCASVGDSRAVLGTISPPDVLPAPAPAQKVERRMLEEVKHRRESKSNPFIQPVQLTKDQKPDDPEENARIVASGGRVQRLIDVNGNRIGPYRVWEANSNSPGLAMSRSLGDMIGKQIGVISTPVCTKHDLHVDDDFFIVLASDGVWDVMDNEDVVHFIECFRGKCKQGFVKNGASGVDVVPNVACIAQLVCEEARVRWYAVVEDEDVMIDDISCIVLEFRRSQGAVSFLPRKNTIIEEVVDREDVDKVVIRKAPVLNDILTRDPRRGSFVTDKII